MMMSKEERAELITFTHDWTMSDDERTEYIDQLWIIMHICMDRYFDDLLKKRTDQRLKLAKFEETIVSPNKGDLLERFESTTAH